MMDFNLVEKTEFWAKFIIALNKKKDDIKRWCISEPDETKIRKYQGQYQMLNEILELPDRIANGTYMTAPTPGTTDKKEKV